jgi:two-component system nitrogen regulation response regulator GlnG
VLIEGESGSGKELVARSLHRLSARSDRPYFALNCAAIAPTLIERRCSGTPRALYRRGDSARGLFRGRPRRHPVSGRNRRAAPRNAGEAAARAGETASTSVVGETASRVSRARIVRASNRDLRQAVRQGAFRADLYHRLSVFTLGVPPLRELDGDKLLLLEHYRRFYAEQSGVQAFSLDPGAERRWLAYPFPGNVRELRNIVIRLTTKHPGRRLTAVELEPEFDLQSNAAGEAAPGEGDVIAQAVRHLERSRGIELDQMLLSLERGYIEAALRITRGNVSQAAKLLGVNRTTLYSRMNNPEAKDK